MPPKTTKSEDIIEALLDSRVVEALAKALSPFISLSIDESLGKKLEGLSASIRDLKGENTRLTKRCDESDLVNAQLRNQLAEQRQRLDDLDAYSRSDNLIIRGLPENSVAEIASASGSSTSDAVRTSDTHQCVQSTVISFCREALGVTVTPNDISIAHRLKAGAKDTVRPVLIRFTNRQVRNTILQSKKKLRSCSSYRNTFISEHLTKATSDLYFEARKMLREKHLHATCTANGQVMVKYSSAPNEKASIVRCKAELQILH